MPEPQSRSLPAIRKRWESLAKVTIKSNLDYARLGEQAFADIAALLEIIDASHPDTIPQETP